jgi:hypothetical protein
VVLPLSNRFPLRLQLISTNNQVHLNISFKKQGHALGRFVKCLYSEEPALTIPGPACITCREKCRKCDRAQPACQRCISKGLECKGYPEKFRFAGLATRGKWKGRAVPTMGRSVPRTQLADAPPKARPKLNAHTRSSAILVNPDSQFSYSAADHPLSHRGRTVELDDLLMLERTELLLTHCELNLYEPPI